MCAAMTRGGDHGRPLEFIRPKFIKMIVIPALAP
jgi:hypothetical protein